MQMLEQLVFASANENKVKEVEQKMGGITPLVGLKAIGCNEEIPETSDTLEGNARQKAWYVWNNYQVNCFADDTGLEIYSLNNEPGVYSARYAGDHKDSNDNIAKVLANMEGIEERNARFRTVICLIIDGKEQLFEGIAEGKIATELKGSEGFGYDPIFIPNGSTRSFAEMSLQEKNEISHRGKAIKMLADYLKSVI